MKLITSWRCIERREIVPQDSCQLTYTRFRVDYTFEFVRILSIDILFRGTLRYPICGCGDVINRQWIWSRSMIVADDNLMTNIELTVTVVDSEPELQLSISSLILNLDLQDTGDATFLHVILLPQNHDNNIICNISV